MLSLVVPDLVAAPVGAIGDTLPALWGVPEQFPPPLALDAPPRGTSYLLHEHWGGWWHDVEKSPLSTEDDNLCWAATAANLLAWTGWGNVPGFAGADAIFAYFQDHWTDELGDPEYALDWWFDGTNDKQGSAGWAQVDVAGGGFYLAENFQEHYAQSLSWSLALPKISEALQAGRGVGLVVLGPGGHAVTCWGYNYNPANPSEYYGVWLTDSDDDASNPNPPDRLRYYDVALSGNRWYLQGFYGSNSWYIDTVESLARRPERPEIVVGHHVLLPDTLGQTIPIYVSGGQQVEGLNFYVQIGDGGIEAGGSDVGPTITSVDIFAGTIFAGGNTGIADLDGEGPADAVPMWEGRETTTPPGTSVAAEGLLGTITIDTTGWTTRRTWPLRMSMTVNGPTDFAGVLAFVFDGTIELDHPPVAGDDTIVVAEGGTATLLAGGQSSVLWNDTDPNLPNDTLRVDPVPVWGPLYGSLVLNPDGTLSYTHDGSEHFADSFVYRVYDEAGFSATATVTITILAVNDPPVARDDAYELDEDGERIVSPPGVLANDTDAENSPLTAILVDGPGHGFVFLQADGGFAYFPEPDYHGLDSFTYRAFDGELESNLATVALTIHSVRDVRGRHVFYNNSVWDAYDPSPGAGDDAAIATDKTALLPGSWATAANYTSYTGGINGVMIDVEELPDPIGIDQTDFVFRVGNDDQPAGWIAAPPPASITVRPGMGVDGSDRITIIWADYLPRADVFGAPNPDGIGKQWLEVVVLATQRTGLPANDVFYFGNAVGESGNSTLNAIVNATDEIGPRNHPRDAANPATVDDPFDYNRDGLVDVVDQLIARSHKTYFLTALRLVAPPFPPAGPPGLSLPTEPPPEPDASPTVAVDAQTGGVDADGATETSAETVAVDAPTAAETSAGITAETTAETSVAITSETAKTACGSNDLRMSGDSAGGELGAEAASNETIRPSVALVVAAARMDGEPSAPGGVPWIVPSSVPTPENVSRAISHCAPAPEPVSIAPLREWSCPPRVATDQRAPSAVVEPAAAADRQPESPNGGRPSRGAGPLKASSSHHAAATDAALVEWMLTWDEPGAAAILGRPGDRRGRRPFGGALPAASRAVTVHALEPDSLWT